MCEPRTTHCIKDVPENVRVEIEVPRFYTGWGTTVQEECKAAVKWAKEIADFLNQHKDYEGIHVYPEWEKRDRCALCNSGWETYDDDGVTCCASCGAIIQEEPPQED